MSLKSTLFSKKALGVFLSALTIGFAVPYVMDFAQAQAGDAEAQEVPKDIQEQLKKQVETSFGPGIKVDSIYKLPYLGGLYEIRVADEIFYTDLKGTVQLMGDLRDPKTGRNITRDRLSKLTAIKFSELPLELALKTVRGKGSRQVAVFEDPNCGYCKRFRDTLVKTDDITIYTFVLPILGEDSTDKAKRLLCSSEKTKAWDDWMLNGRMVSNDGSCNPPISKTLDLAAKLGVRGTPAVFFADGTRSAGAMSPRDFETKLQQVAKR